MLTCKDTYLFVAVGVLIAVAAALFIASDSIELAKDSSDDMREQKAALKVAGNSILLIAGLVFVWRGRCIKKIDYQP